MFASPATAEAPKLQLHQMQPKQMALVMVKKDYKDYAKQYFCLHELVSHESGWRVNALNHSSGAFGLFQFLPSTWGNYKFPFKLPARLTALPTTRRLLTGPIKTAAEAAMVDAEAARDAALAAVEDVAAVVDPAVASAVAALSTDDIDEGVTNKYYSTTLFSSDFSGKTTSNLAEGTNEYWTNTRFDTRFDTRLGTKTTTDLAEGSNLYYTNARFDTRLAAKSTSDVTEGSNLYYTDSRFDTRLALKSTTNLSEGANLYYTDARFDTRLAAKTTTNLSEGTNLYYTDARFDTRLAAKSTTNLSEGTNLYYTSARFNTDLATKSTTNLAEGMNLYYTDARAKSAAVVNSTAGSETDQAASVSAMKTYVQSNGGGGGGSLTWEKIGDLSPINNSQDGIKLEGFSAQDSQEIYLTLTVPASYVAGTQIKLNDGAFFTSSTSGNVLFKAQAALIRAASTVLGTYSNIHTSTNSVVAAPAVSNRLANVGSIDLSSASGTINSVAIAAGDRLRVRLYRDILNESGSASGFANLMINAMSVKFN